MKKQITLLLVLISVLSLKAQVLTSVRSNGGAPAQTRTVTDWLHYDGDNNTRAGTSNAHTAGAYVKIKSNLLNPHIGRQVEELQIYIGDTGIVNGDVTVNIYTDLTAAPVYTQTVPTSSLTSNDWNTITLTTPYQIATNAEFYIGYYYNCTGGYFAGIDDGSNFEADANYIIFNGTLYEMSAVGLSKNFNIRAGIGGATAANDTGISNVAIDETVTVGNVDVVATIMNYGSNTLNSIDFNYQIDGGTVQTQTLTGLNLASGQSTTVTHSTPWNCTTTGSHQINVFTSNFNGNGNDDNLADDSMTVQVFAVNEIFPRTVVYEEGTGTWCGWCVRGIVGLKDMAHFHNDGSWIGIAVHNGDPMVVADYDNGLGFTGFPNGKINRKPTDVDPDFDNLEAAYTDELQKAPIGKIEITNNSFDDATREITAEVTMNFALDIPNADFNASLIIVEDGVTGTGSGYDQHNYYSNNYDLIDWEGTNYRNLPDPIPAAQMVYNHVGRALVGGFNGVAGSIPSSVTYGTPYTYTFTYTLPANIDENEVELVAVILDNASGEIVNGNGVRLATAGINEFFEQNNISIYPNPAIDNILIQGAENMDIELLNIQGASIYKKQNIAPMESINVSNLPNGIYLVKFTQNNQSGVKKIMIAR